MLKIGIGQSAETSASEAGKTACQQALKEVGGQANLLLVFSTVDLDQKEMLKAINEEAKGISIAGCSSMKGIINGEILEKGVMIMAISSDKMKFQLGVGRNVAKNPTEAGKMLSDAIKDEKLALIVACLESVGVNGSAVVRGIQENAGKCLPIIGGLASDASTFTKTYQYFNKEVLTDSAVGIGISGEFGFGIGVRHGWQSVGLPVKVTKSVGSMIQEINNKPAIKFFEDYFGKEEAKQLYKPLSRICYVYPLGMSVEGSRELLIRNPFVANEKGEIICAGEVPQGSEVRLMLGDQEKAVEAARQAAKKAKEKLKKAPPKAVIVFNCAARYMLLDREADKEIKAIQEVFGKDVPIVGFYTYGELAPLGDDSALQCRAMFHNETMTLLALSD